MLKAMSSLAVLLISSAAFAETVDFADLKENGAGKVHECMHEAWKAADTSDEQNNKAGEIIAGARDVMKKNKEAIQKAMKGMMVAWKAHPISRDAVIAAEKGLMEAGAPVHGAIRDAQVGVINLLSKEQREVFNEVFMECVRE
ncbi:MAG: hypothetical protein AB7P04_12260 [Bacteriovoracia bacterium]